MSNAQSIQRARSLRKNMTEAERILWRHLRAHRLGKSFRRQSPIGRYIVDFVCFEKRLVIELDGGQHAEASQARHDKQRTLFLEQEGFRVLRFWNNEVMTNLDGVLMVIEKAVLFEFPPP